MSEYYTNDGGIIEDVLAEHGVYASLVRGVSMMPLLRQGKDVVYIVPLSESVKKYDVLLYVRKGKYILHRVIGFYSEGYVIRGDNTYKKEYIPSGDVVGILTKYYKNGRERSTKGKRFAFYGMLVQLFYLPRYALFILKRKISKLIKK